MTNQISEARRTTYLVGGMLEDALDLSLNPENEEDSKFCRECGTKL